MSSDMTTCSSDMFSCYKYVAGSFLGDMMYGRMILRLMNFAAHLEPLLPSNGSKPKKLLRGRILSGIGD